MDNKHKSVRMENTSPCRENRRVVCIFGFAHNRKFQSYREIESTHEFEVNGRDGIVGYRDILTYGRSEDNRIDEFHSGLRNSNGKLVEL